MEQGALVRRRGERGGSVALAELIGDHEGELDYDLMTMAGMQLADLGHGLSSLSLVHFAQNLPPSSATRRATAGDGGEEGAWEDPAMVPQLAATLIDEVRGLQWILMSRWSKTRVAPPEPIPRPGVRPQNVRTYGSDPIPVSEFDDWWNEVYE